MIKKLLSLQTLILLGGVVFSWTTLFQQFLNFHSLYGTIFRIKDCSVPNPVTTACFYGAIAFVVAFLWSLLLMLRASKRGERYLRNFLLFGVVFASSVLTYEFLVYYRVIIPPVQGIGCSPGVFPLKTPCFKGGLFFLIGSIVAVVTTRKMRLEKGEEQKSV